MLALQVVIVCLIIFSIISFIIYFKGYKELGLDIFKGLIGAVGLWVFLVLAIGLAPVSMG